jgi:hypothetical protein
MGTYRHPRWMLAAGWVVVLIMGGLSVPVLVEQVSGLFSPGTGFFHTYAPVYHLKAG